VRTLLYRTGDTLDIERLSFFLHSHATEVPSKQVTEPKNKASKSEQEDAAKQHSRPAERERTADLFLSR